MAEVDTSSYKQPALPSFLDIASKYGGLQQQQQQIQSNQLGIDQQKLNLVNQRFSTIAKQYTGLINKADLSQDDITQQIDNDLKLGLIPPDMAATEKAQIPATAGMPGPQAAKVLSTHLSNKLTQAMTTMEAINYHLGQRSDNVGNNQQTQPTTFSPKPGMGLRPLGPPIQNQLPVTTPTVADGANPAVPRGTPTYLGPTDGPPPLPAGSIFPFKPGTDPPQIMGTSKLPTANAPVISGLPPGAGAAMQASGEHLAQDRLAATSFQRDIFPLEKAIPALETLGTKGTGPGTETINQMKSFVLSNVPGVKESDFNGTVKDYDTAHKYLTDFVNQTGNSGTNDKLAAAFAGNPSTRISNAAAVDVAKSALALRRMKQAQLLTFEQSGLPESEYSKWNAKFTNALDPRAFGVDKMDKNTLKKLYAQLDKNPIESKRFDQSLDIAHKLGFISPPSEQ